MKKKESGHIGFLMVGAAFSILLIATGLGMVIGRFEAAMPDYYWHGLTVLLGGAVFWGLWSRLGRSHDEIERKGEGWFSRLSSHMAHRDMSNRATYHRAWGALMGLFVGATLYVMVFSKPVTSAFSFSIVEALIVAFMFLFISRTEPNQITFYRHHVGNVKARLEKIQGVRK